MHRQRNIVLRKEYAFGFLQAAERCEEVADPLLES